MEIISEAQPEELSQVNNEKIFTAEVCHSREAEALLVSLESFALRRFDPRPSAYVNKGIFQVKLDEVRSKVDALEGQTYDDRLSWTCEKINLLLNFCANLESALRGVSSATPATPAEGISQCNDADQVLDCLRLELRQRSEQLTALGPITKRLAKVKAHYHAQLMEDWKHQVRWQISDFPRSQQLIISSGAADTFMLIRILRTYNDLTNELLEKFVELFVKPLEDDRVSLDILEQSSSKKIEAIVVQNRSGNSPTKVDQLHNLQTAFSFLSGTLMPLLGLHEDSREVVPIVQLLTQKARRESASTLEELANFLQTDLPQTAALLQSYATERDASREALRAVSELRETMVTALEPTETIEMDNMPGKLSRCYLVSAWVAPLTEHILGIPEESTLTLIFPALLQHLSSLESEALSCPRKVAIYLNNAIFMANRFCLHLPVSSIHVQMLKLKGTSVFLRYVNQQKVPEVAVSLPVSSALRVFTANLESLKQMELAWKDSLPFDNFSRSTALLFNALSNGIESYVFQQKFLTEFEVGLLKSLIVRTVALADSWIRASERPLAVSPGKMNHLLRLLQMTSEDIALSWRSSVQPLSMIFSAQQVTSLARARFTLTECDKLTTVIS